MLVSVTERTREIGLRKALGATHRNIMTQFFVEGAFLTAFSGGIGLAICTAFVTLLAQLPSPDGFDTPRIVPASAVVCHSFTVGGGYRCWSLSGTQSSACFLRWKRCGRNKKNAEVKSQNEKV